MDGGTAHSHLPVEDAFHLEEFLIEVDQEPDTNPRSLQVRSKLGLMYTRKLTDRLELDHDRPFHEEIEPLHAKQTAAERHLDLMFSTVTDSVKLELDLKRILIDRLEKPRA